MSKLALPQKNNIGNNKLLNIYFTGLFAIFLDQEYNRAMVGILDEKNHETKILVNGKALKIGDKIFTEEQKNWQIKLCLQSQSQSPLSLSRGGTFETGDAFDYFVDIEQLEGCKNKETLPLRHESFKGRFYLNAGEFRSFNKAFKASAVNFVRQDSRIPLATWQPRPIAESLQVTIPLIEVKSASLQIGNDFDAISVPLDLSGNIEIWIDNKCKDERVSTENKDTDFVAFYKLIADNRTPAVPVKVSQGMQASLIDTYSANTVSKKAPHTKLPDTKGPDIIAAPTTPGSPTSEAMCGGVFFGNTKSF